MPLSTILFDFVGVLLLPDPTHPLDDLAAIIDSRIGAVTNDDAFRAQVMAEFHLSEIQFQAILQSIAEKYVKFEPLWAQLPRLREKYKLGIINNGTWLTYPYFNARLKLDRQFDAFISSAREGVCKPDPRIYLCACEALGVTLGECLFMDDSERNTIGAGQVGMQTILWEDPQVGFAQFLYSLSQGRVL
jgi:epoxide hydrolase-like predicted phosphatase